MQLKLDSPRRFTDQIYMNRRIDIRTRLPPPQGAHFMCFVQEKCNNCFLSEDIYRPCNGLIPHPRSRTDCHRIEKLKGDQAFHGSPVVQSWSNRKKRYIHYIYILPAFIYKYIYTRVYTRSIIIQWRDNILLDFMSGMISRNMADMLWNTVCILGLCKVLCKYVLRRC
jgi:hypothetical protein